MEAFQQLEQDVIAKLDDAANLSREDYKTVLETILGECEDRLAALEEEDDEE